MVSDVSFPRVNGVSTSIQTFRTELRALGHESSLIAPAYPRQESPTDPAEIRLRSRPVPGDREDRLIRLRDVLALTDTLRARQFDIVHIHTPFVAHYAGLRLARRLGLPVVGTCHTYFEEYGKYYFPRLPESLVRFCARRLTVSQCAALDAIVVPSEQMLGVLRGYGVTVHAERIPTGIDTARFRGGDGSRFRAAHGIPATRPVLLHISRVAHEKNLDFILRAVKRVTADVPDLLLVVAGDGPALGHVKELAGRLGIGANCLFVGYLDRATALLDCYRSGDAFVFASRTETQGLVLLEALALGVPVVSTAVMGTADVLKDVKGAVVAPDDEAGFAAAVSALLRDPARRARLAALAPADAAAWSARAMAERLVGFYERVLARR